MPFPFIQYRFSKLAGSLTAAALVALAAAGCSQSSGSRPEGPAEAVDIYMKNNCVSCHGSELQGRMGENTNLQKVGARMSKAEIEHQIRGGGGGMPAFGERLSAEEISKLADWLASGK